MGRWILFFSHVSKQSKGTLVLLNPKNTCKVEKQICDKKGTHILLLGLGLTDQRIVFANIYSPNDVSQHVTFFKELQKQLQAFFEKTNIIGGDYKESI